MVRTRFRFDDLFNDPFVARGLMALEALQQELGQVATRAFAPATSASTSVPVNVGFHEDKVRVVAEVPGVSTEDLTVTVQGKAVEISGKRAVDEPNEQVKVLRRERWSGEFKRVIELPYEVEADSVDAVYAKGILTVTLTRQKSTEPKKVRVKSE